MPNPLVQIAVLAMGELSPAERDDVNATFAEFEPKPFEDFLPISAGLTLPAAELAEALLCETPGPGVDGAP